MMEIKAKLADYSFLQGLASAHIDVIVQSASYVEFEPRELIFREGDDADTFYLILEGRVAVEIFTPDCGPNSIQTLNPGDVLGWSWLMEPYRWHFDAQAVMATQAVAFDAVRIRNNCETDPALGYALLSRFVPAIVERLQATRMQLLDLYHANG